MLSSILSTDVTIMELITCMGAAILLGVLTALVFQFRSRHSAGFAVTLAILPLAVCVVIMLVNGNIGAGVAVAGAFALVRFRSVPGTAKEIAAIFIAMTLGLALGMGYVTIAFIFFAFASILTIVLELVGFGKVSGNAKHIKITIPENYDYEGLFDDLFEKYTNDVVLTKIRTTNMGTLIELTYEARMKSKNIPKEFIDEIRTRNGNLNIIISDFNDKEML